MFKKNKVLATVKVQVDGRIITKQVDFGFL